MRETEHKRNQLISIQMSHPSALELDSICISLHKSTQCKYEWIFFSSSSRQMDSTNAVFGGCVAGAVTGWDFHDPLGTVQRNEILFCVRCFRHKMADGGKKTRVQHSHRLPKNNLINHNLFWRRRFACLQHEQPQWINCQPARSTSKRIH